MGFLDGERAAGVEWSASDFKESAATYYAQHELDGSCTSTDDDIRNVRDTRRELFARWAALPTGETLELRFGRPAAA